MALAGNAAGRSAAHVPEAKNHDAQGYPSLKNVVFHFWASGWRAVGCSANFPGRQWCRRLRLFDWDETVIDVSNLEGQELDLAWRKWARNEEQKKYDLDVLSSFLSY